MTISVAVIVSTTANHAILSNAGNMYHEKRVSELGKNLARPECPDTLHQLPSGQLLREEVGSRPSTKDSGLRRHVLREGNIASNRLISR